MTDLVLMAVQEPLDLIKHSVGKKVIVKMRQDRVLTGTLHAFDEHLNLLLGDSEEKIGRIGEDVKVRKSEMLFARGDNVVLVSPVLE